eukprot:NODE_1683_length_557_cov_833.787402_g1359_i0.p1 GENE.NODE_1683_length_557_cov_833.787402_g1359_i0~~NODE_1683_length_557_cov_833.787402_g1359_i0.p1  ORF type:complete len:145 (-),score=33.56 NODE_1683_length_557_cov_833.787402_g1359_i0:92-526(-)
MGVAPGAVASGGAAPVAQEEPQEAVPDVPPEEVELQESLKKEGEYSDMINAMNTIMEASTVEEEIFDDSEAESGAGSVEYSASLREKLIQDIGQDKLQAALGILQNASEDNEEDVRRQLAEILDEEGLSQTALISQLAVMDSRS